MMVRKKRSKIDGMKVSAYNIGLLISIISVLTLGTQSDSANASRGEVSCYDRGFIDGEDHPFSQRTFDRCGDGYYQGFIQGCTSVEGNSRDSCESATDD